jgi:hypothetical protein
MKRILLILFATALAWGQQENGPRSAIIDVKYADPVRIQSMLQAMFRASMKADSSLHAIAVSANSPDDLAAITAAIKKLDVPTAAEPDVDLTVYLIYGLAQGPTVDDIPQDLSATVKQLHGLFTYKSYKLADSLMLRGRAARPSNNNQQEVEGTLPGLRYTLAYSNLSVSPEPPRTIHIDGLNFRLNGPEATTFKDGRTTTAYTDTLARLSVDLDLKEGQKTVVGKSSINPAGDALILVIVPKVAE